MTRQSVPILAILALFLWAVPVRGDEIKLSDGRVIVGQIRSQRDGILEIMQQDGQLTHINVLKIESIRKSAVVIQKPEPKPDPVVDTQPGEQPAPVESGNRLYDEKFKQLESEIDALKRAGVAKGDGDFAALEAELNSIREDMAAGTHTLDRLDALQDKLDRETKKQWEAYQDLKDGLTKNSEEMIKVIVSLSDLQAKVDAFEPNAALPELQLGKDEIASLQKVLADMRAEVARSQEVVEDVKQLKISNEELNRKLETLSTGRVAALETDSEATKKRIADLERQNQELAERLNNVQGGNVNVDDIRLELDAMKTQLAEFDRNAKMAGSNNPPLESRQPSSGADPMLLYRPIDGNPDLLPWDREALIRKGNLDAKDAGLAGRLTVYSPPQCEKWTNIAAGARKLADEAFATADAMQNSRKLDIDLALRDLRGARSLYALALAEYNLVFDNSHDPGCIPPIQAIEARLHECDLRVAYLERIR